MTRSKTALTFLRLFALLGAMIVLALGLWALIIIRDINHGGKLVLESLRSRLQNDVAAWSHLFTAAAQGATLTWTIVITSSVTGFATLLNVMANRHYWLRISPTTAVLIDLAATASSFAIFGCALSLTLSIGAFSTPSYSTLDSAKLTYFALVGPLSRALTITSALTSVFLVTACSVSLPELHARHTQAKDVRSFEPTVSALGMGHGFHALHPPPRMRRDAVPSLRDSYEASRMGPERLPDTKHVIFASEGAWMSRKHSRWSASTTSPSGIEGDIMRLLEVKKARRAVPVRPARPWNEVWNGGANTQAV